MSFVSKFHKIIPPKRYNVKNNFTVVLSIAIELLKQATLLYTKKQQVAAG